MKNKIKEVLMRIKNKSVTELDLTLEELGTDEIRVIAEALKINTSLTEVDLTCNGIGAQGAKSIAEALKINNSIIKFSLYNNQLKAKGAKIIAEALKYNTSLTDVELGNNQIGAEGAKAIAEALKYNTTIIEIGLSSNEIGIDGAKVFAEAIKTNRTLLNLAFFDNQIEKEQEDIIETVTERNEENIYNFIENNLANLKGIESVGKETVIDVLKSIKPQFVDKTLKWSLFNFCRFIQKAPDLIDEVKNLKIFIANNFFYLSGVCKKFEVGHLFKTIPPEILLKITIGLKLSVFKNYSDDSEKEASDEINTYLPFHQYNPVDNIDIDMEDVYLIGNNS